MKRLYSLLILMLAVMQQVFAQYAFYVYRNDGTLNAFFTEDVDSIVYGNTENGDITQNIYTKDSIYMFPIESVDSIAYNVNDIVISPDYLSLEDYSYSISSISEDEQTFHLNFDGVVPKFRDDALVVLETDNLMFLRRVKNVVCNGTAIVLYTSTASLSDVFLKGTFTLTSTNNLHPVNSRTFYPVSKSHSRRNTGVKVDLFDKEWDYSGYVIWENSFAKLYAESCVYKFNMHFTVCCNFNSYDEAFEKYRKSNLELTKASLVGGVSSDFRLRFDAWKEGEFAPGEPRTLKENIHKPFKANFLVNGVPVEVQLTTHLMAEGRAHASANFTATAGYSASAEAELGVSWSQKEGAKPLAKYTNKFSMYNPTIIGDAHLDGKISVFPRINFSIYGITGPSFDIKPYLKLNADLAFWDNLYEDRKEDFYAAEFALNAGYDAACGINFLPYFGSNLVFESPSWNVYDKLLHKCPYNIEYLDVSGLNKVKAGVPVTASFRVSDYNFLDKDFKCTLFPLVVKFTTNCGSVKEFGIVNPNTGLVDVEWTPSHNLSSGTKPELHAFLYNKEGIPYIGATWKAEFPIPIQISSVTTAAQYRPTDHPQHFIYKDSPYEFKYDVATTVKLTDDEGVENWGYVYEGPYEGDKKSRISLKGATSEYEDTRFAYYRNGSPTEHTARLYPFVKYTGDDEYYYGEPVDYPLNYPETSTVELTGCSTNDVVTHEHVEYNGVTYDYCSTFILDYNATGAYWLTVGAEEIGNGWNGWDGNLPARERARAADGSNRLTINYYYNQKVLEGDYLLRIKGSDEQHNTSCTSNKSVRLTHNGKTFTGCELIQ